MYPPPYKYEALNAPLPPPPAACMPSKSTSPHPTDRPMNGFTPTNVPIQSILSPTTNAKPAAPIVSPPPAANQSSQQPNQPSADITTESAYGETDGLRPRKRPRNRTSIAPRLCKGCGRTYRYKRPHLMRYHYDELMRGERVGSDDGGGEADEGREHEYEAEEEHEYQVAAEQRARPLLGPGQSVFRADGALDKKDGRRTTSGLLARFCARCNVPVVEEWSEHLTSVHGEVAESVTNGFRAVNQQPAMQHAAYDAVLRRSVAISSPSCARVREHTSSRIPRGSSEDVSTQTSEEAYEKLLRNIRSTAELSGEQRNTLIFKLFAEQIKTLSQTLSVPRNQEAFGLNEAAGTPQLTSSTSMERDEDRSVATPKEEPVEEAALPQSSGVTEII